MANAEDTVLISVAQVRARYGNVSQMWVERRLRDSSGFPRPRYIGRLRFWLLEELEAWERRLKTKGAA